MFFHRLCTGSQGRLHVSTSACAPGIRRILEREYGSGGLGRAHNLVLLGSDCLPRHEDALALWQQDLKQYQAIGR